MRIIPLTKGKFAIVDAEDFEFLNNFKWNAHDCGKKLELYYAETGIRIGNRMFMLKMHRMILNDPKGFDVDHRNGDGLDNRRFNLRKSSHKNNTRNRTKSSAEHSSQYKGVCYSKQTRTWSASIGDTYRKVHIGFYATEIEAARAYDAKAQEIYGEFAKTNGIDTNIIPRPIKRKTRSKYRGVYFDKRRGTWQARFYLGSGRYQYIGAFENEQDAATAYTRIAQHGNGGALSLLM